jgi:hypothetical protein
MDNQKFIDVRLEKVEGIVGDVPAKGLEWGIFAVLVQIAFMFIPLIRAAEQSVQRTGEARRKIRHSSNHVGGRHARR